MGGVGSFNRQNLTLYVGRIKETGNAQDTEEVIRRHFGEWGEIDRGMDVHLPLTVVVFTLSIVRVLQYRSVAFVTYKDELHGQFAKEAMACQSLDNDEILNVRHVLCTVLMLADSQVSFRWATEDPNPVSKVAEKRRLEEVGKVAISSKLDTRIIDAMRSVRALEDEEDIPQPYQEEQDIGSDGEDEDPRKRRRIEAAENDEMLEQLDQAEQKAASGLLSAEAMQGQFFAV